MPYSVDVVPRDERKAIIEAELSSSNRPYRIKFRDGLTDVPQIRIPIGLPVYRMRNGRTEDEQNDILLSDSSLPRDFFSAGEENVSPQRIQHELLLKLARDPNRPIYEVLQKSGQQEEPLLVTRAGVVVNGNRRLAAMRDLVAEDAARYGAFAHVDVAVLPAEANERDLDVIEVSLQMAQETKQEYTWINQRLKMRHLLEDNEMTPQEVARVMNYPSVRRVNAELQELKIAEEYLATYLKRPRDYKKLKKGHQVFKEIASRVTKKEGRMHDVAKGIAFAIVGARGEYEDRAYAYRESFGEYADQIADGLIRDLGIVPLSDGTPVQASDDDPLAGLEDSAGSEYEQLIAVLSEPDNASDLSSRIIALHDTIKQADDDEDRRSRALSELRRISTQLVAIEIDSLDPTLRSEADAVITEMVARLEDLKQRMSALPVAEAAASE